MHTFSRSSETRQVSTTSFASAKESNATALVHSPGDTPTRVEQKDRLETCDLHLVDVQFAHDGDDVMVKSSDEELKRLIDGCVRPNVGPVLNEPNVQR